MTTLLRELAADSYFPHYSSLQSLHSFPTRRSSDLRSHHRRRRSPGRAGTASRRPRSGPWPAADRWPRSEEHTSELQSRGHLVCRLLLEKKKVSEVAMLDCRSVAQTSAIELTRNLR